jgi:hypothetical protein
MRLRLTSEDVIKMDLREIEYECVDQVEMFYDRFQ